MMNPAPPLTEPPRARVFYGYCPVCYEPGVHRERRPNGNDRCTNMHIYLSANALTKSEREAKMAQGKVSDPSVNPAQDHAVAEIKQMANEMQKLIEDNCPAGRRRSIAITHLETAAMYAVKSRIVGDE